MGNPNGKYAQYPVWDRPSLIPIVLKAQAIPSRSRHYQLPEDSLNTVRSLTVMLFTLLCALTIQSASAQSDGIDCGSFSGDQAAAQAYFDANGQPESLDGDGDGQACASPDDGDFSGGPSAGPEDITCGDFSNDQAAAQAYFDANGQPSNLDGDGDGQACASPEDGDYTSGPSAGPESSDHITCASFSGDQAAAQAYFDANGQPDFLDGDGDGQACASPEDGDFTSKPTAGPEGGSTSDAADDDTSTTSVENLPVAGAGPGLPSTPGSDIGILLAMSLILGAGAHYGNRQLRR
jgi:hypothetical protein